MPTDRIELERNTGLPSLGTHLFKVAKVRQSETEGGSGFHYWMVGCVIQDKGPDQGKEVLHILSLSPGARFKIDEFLDAVNAPKNGSASGEQFIGKTFRAEVVHDTYNDTLRAGLKNLFPTGSETEELLDVSDITDIEDDEDDLDLGTLDFGKESPDEDVPF
jgi:hypothetical protein